ncbi:LAQU0S14e00958g1_1 [Lachancea quebecensis]|uniref:LAQU0S14e00958g1_1 n=1 Tax=Lachancea quebecensis TaxID=1654605 RepID=A0A0N7MM53_9SACH|nr:LAQU0S14e00958g1_1 [Lachancea quebecensis]
MDMYLARSGTPIEARPDCWSFPALREPHVDVISPSTKLALLNSRVARASWCGGLCEASPKAACCSAPWNESLNTGLSPGVLLACPHTSLCTRAPSPPHGKIFQNFNAMLFRNLR